MLETTDPYVFELAQHIVTLTDFWRRKTTNLRPNADIRIVRTLIETGLDISPDRAEVMALAVARKLAGMDGLVADGASNTTNDRVEAVSALLQEAAGYPNGQPTLFEGSLPG